MFVPSWQRRGLGKAACRSIVDYGIRQLGLERIECRCATGNIGSRRGIEQMGFRYEGIARSRATLSGGFTDFAVYGMLGDDWELARDYTLRHTVQRTKDGAWIVEGLGALKVKNVGEGVHDIDRLEVLPHGRHQHVGRRPSSRPPRPTCGSPAHAFFDARSAHAHPRIMSPSSNDAVLPIWPTAGGQDRSCDL